MSESFHKRHPCLILIGMPGAGKSTVGELLARQLRWAFLDTDKIMEALYGVRLQDIVDHFGKDEFLKIEARIITTLDASRCVIATGGSVVYNDAAMKKLKNLGSVIYLDVPFEDLLKRIAESPDRGIAIAPGQTLKSLYEERNTLYNRYKDFSLCARDLSPADTAMGILKLIPELKPDKI